MNTVHDINNHTDERHQIQTKQKTTLTIIEKKTNQSERRKAIKQREDITKARQLSSRQETLQIQNHQHIIQ